MKIGILGAGQLGRMVALAGYPLGLHFRFLDCIADAPASVLAPTLQADFEDETALTQFAAGLSCITYEFENIPLKTVSFLSQQVPVFPPPKALEVSQDRWFEKSLFNRLHIPTTRCVAVDTNADLETAATTLQFPFVLKTRRFGYDGKGQFVIRSSADLEAAWKSVDGQSLIAEEFVAFDSEVSLIAVRSRSGQIAFYPLIQNWHDGGILRRSRVLTHAPAALQAHAQGYAEAILNELNYVGVLTIEFFRCGDRLVANEMAPRVHNSGHWTIEGADTSQFENHLRAILGWPLGSTECRGEVAMLNLIGEVPSEDTILQTPGAHLHLYGKLSKPGRKLGHVTLCAADTASLDTQLTALKRIISCF